MNPLSYHLDQQYSQAVDSLAVVAMNESVLEELTKIYNLKTKRCVQTVVNYET